MRILHPTGAQLLPKPEEKPDLIVTTQNEHPLGSAYVVTVKTWKSHLINKPCMTNLQHINYYCRMISSCCTLKFTARLNSTRTRTSRTGQEHRGPADVRCVVDSVGTLGLRPHWCRAGQEVTMPIYLVSVFIQGPILGNLKELSGFVACSIKSNCLFFKIHKT